MKPEIAKLAVTHDATDFDCGQVELNEFIRLYALAGQRANISQTYVAVLDQKIIGYHTLTVGDVVYDDAPERLAKGVPRYPIPVVLLARLAVDLQSQNKGLGAALLVDATRRTLQVADIAGVRAMLVHARDETARDFYAHFGFEPFRKDAFVLYSLLKDLKMMYRT
jgi:GNAT superfamily N-acetyltransferase